MNRSRPLLRHRNYPLTAQPITVASQKVIMTHPQATQLKPIKEKGCSINEGQRDRERTDSTIGAHRGAERFPTHEVKPTEMPSLPISSEADDATASDSETSYVPRSPTSPLSPPAELVGQPIDMPQSPPAATGYNSLIVLRYLLSRIEETSQEGEIRAAVTNEAQAACHNRIDELESLVVRLQIRSELRASTEPTPQEPDTTTNARAPASEHTNRRWNNRNPERRSQGDGARILYIGGGPPPNAPSTAQQQLYCKYYRCEGHETTECRQLKELQLAKYHKGEIAIRNDDPPGPSTPNLWNLRQQHRRENPGPKRARKEEEQRK
ncbi:hypothetical protein F2Q70_00011364 [Brassica cretica]|uniref:Uncharacterized protein n=1 Tax=Brassica cretica TaxID=69181 RepID=A0A8S9LW97_BRACR|nr:hypothetical protein F2Q70_00011364 [Brassica cretica]